jgi:hypothetical protein
MRPLTLDDLLPLDDYASRRREFFEAHTQYVDRYRRVRVGPDVTFLFQNRQTLWFHVQELIRVARLCEHNRLQAELELHNQLLPTPGTLQAALILSPQDDLKLSDTISFWNDVKGEAIQLRIGERRLHAELITCRPEDRCNGTAHWVQFLVDAQAQRELKNSRKPAWMEIAHGTYRYVSPALSDEVRQSLVDDLSIVGSGQ